MSVCFLNLLPNGEYLILLIVAYFSNSHFSCKNFPHIENLHLSTYSDDKSQNFSSLSVSFALLNFVINCFDFLINSHFLIGSS